MNLHIKNSTKKPKQDKLKVKASSFAESDSQGW